MSIEPGETRSKIETAGPRAPRFELCVLGQFRLAGEQGTVDLGNKKQCGLMAFLACARVPQRRDKLMSLLWGSHFDVQAQQNLRKALSRLRHTLGEDVFANGDEMVSLRPGAVGCDATAFERLIEEGSRESLRAATDLYKDMFLSDVSIQEEGWVDWMTDQRNRLEGLAVNALVRLGAAEEDRGDLQRALEAASRAIAMDELREDAHRLIIRCLAAAGRRAEALKRYDQLAALLKRELDVEPDASTRSLIDELRLPDTRLQQRGTSRAASISDAPHFASTDSPGAAPPPTASRPREDAAPQRADDLVPPETVGAAIDHRWRRLVPLGAPLTAVALSIAGAVVLLAVSGLSLPGLKLAMHTGAALSNVPGLDAVPIAVLQFTPLADDEEARMSAKMITDDLTNILSRVPGLSVISRQSSQQLKSRPIDVFAVGKELGVRYVLDGSVRTQSEMLRVNVELIAAETRLQVWSDHFERRRVEGDAARDEIVKGLGRALQVEMIRAENARMARHPSEQPEINELVSAGWAAMMASSSANTLAQAEAAFREALRRDAKNARAMRGLAAHHLTMVGDMHTPEREPYLSEAEQLLDQVLKRNPAASAPYFYLGILHRDRGELQPALESFAHSTALNPSFAPGYAHMGSVLTRLGRMDEALEQIAYAMRLSPKDPNFQIWTLFAGWAELERGHDEAAFEWFSRALALNPQSAQAHGSLAAAYALTSDLVNAAKYEAKFRELTPGFSDERRLEGFGAAFERPGTPHRLVEGLSLALASSR